MSQQNIIIEKALITTSNGSDTFDIASVITDIFIYEHIDKPYLTGTLQFLDTIGVFDQAQFQGLEKFELILKENAGHPGMGDKRKINRTFVIDEIMDATKSNDNSELITLHLIEEIGFQSTFLNVNKAYSGSSRNILEKIIREFHPGIEVSVDVDEALYPMKLVVPNMTPLAAAQWIKDKTTSSFGTPFYLYSTLNEQNKLRFESLATILERGKDISAQKPYTFSRAATADSMVGPGQQNAPFVISSYTQQNLSISDLIARGFITSEQGYWDTSTASSETTYFAVEDNVAFIEGLDTRFKFKNSYMYKDEPINRLVGQSKKNYAIHASYPYEAKVSFREMESLNRSLTAKALRNILVTGAKTITVSGTNFSFDEKSKTIGNMIKLKFLNNNVSAQSMRDPDSIVDKVKSGKHMIYSARHNISLEKYDINLTCVKLDNLESTK